ncbi:MAG: hypothetical protein DRP89_01245 [Candidatus Neomarinimicrobiota bacterium]|nr:MAG: hypothetical protein DRP89_01245 [Candidatus Neomarinimicrobiota bacterium]
MWNNYMQRESEKTNPYLVQKILTASSEQLVAYIYDAAIISCARKEKVKASQAVQELINSLNFDSDKNIAVKFFQLYHYILDQINSENFNRARELLNELRETWNKAMKIT